MLQICPKCGKDQGMPAADCRKCGIVFAKYEAPRLTPAEEPGGFKAWHAPPEPKRKRGVLKILLTLAVTGVGLAAIGLLVGFSWVRGTDAYQVVDAVATTHPAMVRTLGEPIDPAKFFVFGMETTKPAGGEATGAATFVLPVEGPRASGIVIADANLVEGAWKVTDAFFVEVEGGPQQVLVQGGRVIGDGIDGVEVEPTAPGLTAEQLLKSDVDSWGETPVERTPRQAPSQRNSVEPASRSKRTARPDCAYTGATSSYVSTIRPKDMRNQVSRSKGCVTLVAIWGAWCPACREHYPYVTNLADTYADAGLAYHSFATDQNPAELEEFLAAQTHRKGVFRLQLDPNRKGSIKRGAEDFGAVYPNAVPFYALFDHNNQVVVQGTTNVYRKLEPAIRERLL